MYDTVLIPTDGSEHALRAVEHGRYLARAFNATVHVVYVVDVQSAAGAFDAGGVDREFVSRLERKGEAAIDGIEAVLDGVDSIRTAVIRGDPANALLEYAEDHDIALLAMGTRGRTGVRRYIAGSVTERVVRLAHVPVLTVRATEGTRLETGYEELLIPTDGSEQATAAVEHGIAIAEQTGARVHAVNIVDVADTAIGPHYTLPAELLAQLEADGEEATEAIASRARSASVDAVTAVGKGVPSKDLLTYVEDHDIDLVAMGTAGRTGIDRYLLGSTTEQLIRHADVPVLAVNAKDRVTAGE